MRLAAFAGVLVALFVRTSPGATVGVYFNQADWEAAMSLNGANQLTSVGFDDSQWTTSLQTLPSSTTLVSQSSSAASNGMGITIDSTCSAPGVCGSLGQVSNGFWVDDLAKYGSTTFNFGSDIYGFGGDFDISGGNGLFISPAGDLPYPYYDGANPFFYYPGYNGFIGIISDQPMSDIFISWGDNGSCYECFGNSYTISNFQVATIATPEPNFRFVLAGLLVLAALRSPWCRFLMRCISRQE